MLEHDFPIFVHMFSYIEPDHFLGQLYLMVFTDGTMQHLPYSVIPGVDEPGNL